MTQHIREIVLDVETTGLRAKGDDRIIELACLEIINYVPTGETYHFYINPERDVPEEATRVHGIQTDFLLDKPLFRDVVDGFLEFIKDDDLVIHNAPFDIGFLNAELGRLRKNHKPFPITRAKDTLKMARSKFPGSPATLDALCKRFSIDLSKRTLHGALLDCELLAMVYLELLGGRQKVIEFMEMDGMDTMNVVRIKPNKPRRDPRHHEPSVEDIEKHHAFLKSLKNPIWG